MAYYNSYGQYQQVQPAPAPVPQYTYVPTVTPISYGYPSAYSSGCYQQTVGPSTGLAGYGGASSYKVTLQPVQYQQQQQQPAQSGRSFSTASDSGNNNECGQTQTLPVTGYTMTGYGNSYPSYQQVEQYYYQQAQMTSQQPGTIVTMQPQQTNSQHGSQSQHSMSQPSQSGHQSFSQAQLTEVVQCDQQNDQLVNLAPQIEAAYEAATTQRRQPVIKRQVITVPGTPGRIQQVVRRLPTPTPDIIERVFVVKPQRDVINLVIERPGTPPAQYKDRTVMGKQRRPLIHPRIVRVPARSQFQQLQYQPQYLQALPAPSPMYQQQTSRVPTSCSYQYSQTPEQPALSQLSQGQLSSAEISQASDSQIGCPQSNQSMQSQPTQTQQQSKVNGFVVAPLAYGNEESPCATSYMPALTGQSTTCVQPQSYIPTADPYGAAYAAAVTSYMSQVAPQLTYYGYQAPMTRYY
jgi:hypothetical protein